MSSIFTLNVDLEKIVSELSSLNLDNGRFSFLNKYREPITIFSTMKNLADANGVMVKSTDVPCWWCRVRFDTVPLGCPVSRAKIDDSTLEQNDRSDHIKYKIRYHTVGIFCSINCIKSYILDNMNNIGNSLNLLTCMVLDIDRDDDRNEKQSRIYRDNVTEYIDAYSNIKERPCWRLLKNNGGPLQRDEYFENTSIYIDTIGENVAIIPVSNDYQQYNTMI